MKTYLCLLLIACGSGPGPDVDAGQAEPEPVHTSGCAWCGRFCDPEGSNCCDPETGRYCFAGSHCGSFDFFGKPVLFCSPLK